MPVASGFAEPAREAGATVFAYRVHDPELPHLAPVLPGVDWLPRALAFGGALSAVLGVLLVAIVLTWIVPAGEFERRQEGSRTVVVPHASTRRAESAASSSR